MMRRICRWIPVLSFSALALFMLSGCAPAASQGGSSVRNTPAAESTERQTEFSSEAEETAVPEPSETPATGYADIVNQNRHRQLYLTTETWFGEGGEQNRSQAADRGAYFEVTHGRILADTCYDLSLTDGKAVGDTLELEGAVYHISDIYLWEQGDGKTVFLEYESGEDAGYLALVQHGSDDFYTLSGPDAETKKDILYTGSLYFSKDCAVTSKDPGNEFKDHTVSIGDYLTQDSETVGAEFGLVSEGLILWGNFEIDPSGLIVSYAEIFLP